MRVLSIFGTRPEAIKMAPVVRALENDSFFTSRLCVTAQHRSMLDQVLSLFEITPHIDLDLMKENQSLAGLTCRVLEKLTEVLKKEKPDCVLVQGDTTTAFVAALAAFYERIPVGHIEAGLRTYNIDSPWPEEANRRFISPIAHWNFAPTEMAKEHLLQEAIDAAKCYVTGNTVVDSDRILLEKLKNDPNLQEKCAKSLPPILPGKPLIVMTEHRRENFGKGFHQIFKTMCALSDEEDIQIFYPVHLNPNVRNMAQERLCHCKNIHIIEPLDPLTFLYLMQQSHIIVTDSGGIQEEAPALGKPVLITRDTTERPEAVACGSAHLVGCSPSNIMDEITRLIHDDDYYADMARERHPYGDGHAAKEILSVLKEHKSQSIAA